MSIGEYLSLLCIRSAGHSVHASLLVFALFDRFLCIIRKKVPAAGTRS